MSDSFFIAQNVYKAPHPRIWVETYPRAALTRQVLEKFVDEARDDGGVIGVASAYGAKCVLSVLAFATNRRVLLVPIGRTDLLFSLTQRKDSGDLLEDTILCAESCDKVAFHMDVLASSLYHDLKVRMHGGIDLLSTAVNNDRHSLQAIMNCMGGEPLLNKQSVISLFAGEEREDEVSMQDLALRAWVAWRAATVDRMVAYLTQEPRIDTDYLTEAVSAAQVVPTSMILSQPPQRLSALSKLVRDACRLSALKPTSIENEVAEEYSYQDGQLHVLSTRFKNRLRIGPQVHFFVTRSAIVLKDSRQSKSKQQTKVAKSLSLAMPHTLTAEPPKSKSKPPSRGPSKLPPSAKSKLQAQRGKGRTSY